MLQSMGALVPGLAGPPAPTMMEAAQVLVCVGREPAITPSLSVVARSAMGSALKSPTVPGILVGCCSSL